jgi:D-alanyl-D-alanine carboxypeptidase
MLLGWLTMLIMAFALFSHAARAHQFHNIHRFHKLIHPRLRRLTAYGGPTTSGLSTLVMDAMTGTILSEQDPYTLRYPASLTKLMTLDLAFQALRDHRISLSTMIPVSAEAAAVQPVKLNLAPGQSLSVEQAILGMTTYSANDAATALGQYLGGGSISRFAQMMTVHASALGMTRSTFYNPSGLPNPGQMTDAYDIALLTRHILMTYPEYRYFFGVRSFDFEGRTIPNIDGMLRLYPGAIGMKTGFTNLARFNVVTAAIRHGHLLIGVELHASSWSAGYHTMALMLNQGFAAEDVGPMVAIRRALPALVPVAQAAAAGDAVAQSQAIIHPAVQRYIKPPVIHLPPARLRTRPRRIVQRVAVAGWIAQVGTYTTYAAARHQAMVIHGMRTIGVARVSSMILRGRRLYRAQLAGLDRAGAHYTCHMLARYHRSCIVIAPRNDQLAMR